MSLFPFLFLPATLFPLSCLLYFSPVHSSDGLADISRLQSFKRDLVQNPQRDTKRVEIIIRPPPSGGKVEKTVEVLEGQLVSTDA
jgi:hypothetical protein